MGVFQDIISGGSNKKKRRAQQAQAEQQAAQALENERQRIAAQQDMERRLAEQQAREAAIVAEQQRVAREAAEKARADEEARQMLIKGNRANVDNAFQGFNDDFFKSTADKYVGAYLPSLEEDRARSLDQLKAALAGRGTLESTVGINSISDLEKKYGSERASIASRGSDFANSIREKVNTQKNSLYDAANSAADPQGFAARATGEATSLVNMGGVIPFGQTTAYGSQSQANGVAAPQNASVFQSFLAPLIGAAGSALNAAPKNNQDRLRNTAGVPITGTGTSSVRG